MRGLALTDQPSSFHHADLVCSVRTAEAMMPAPSQPRPDDEDDDAAPAPPLCDARSAYLPRLRDLVKGRVGEELTDEAWADCVRRARSHAGGKAKAARRSAESGTDPGLWIGLYLPPEVAQALALDLPDAERPADLHLTLAFCGKLSDLP